MSMTSAISTPQDTLVIQSVKDVSEFIDKQPATRSSKLVIAVALGGIFVDAYDLTSLGIGVPGLTRAFNLTPSELGMVAAIMAVGQFIGALWGGVITDRLGRYKVFLLDLLLLVGAAIGCAVSVNLPMLVVFRFLLGFGVGLDFPVALSFVAEFTNRMKRGAGVNAWQLMWYAASITTALIILPFYVYANLGDNLWRVAVGFGALPALLVLLMRGKYLNESAPWAAQNVSLDAAAKILERTYGVKARVQAGARPEPTPDVAKREKLAILFSPLYLKRTLLISIILITQSCEYYAIGFNLPILSQSIFGGDYIYSIIGTVLFNIFGVIGSLTSMRLTEQMGNRRMTIVGYTGVFLSLVCLYFGGSNLPVAAMAGLIALIILSHSFGPGSQGTTMAALSYPTRIRGMGIGWSSAIARVGTVCGLYFFPVLKQNIGLAALMGVLAFVPLLGLIGTLFIKWEPVGKDMELTGDA